MKKTLALVLAAVMLASLLVACSGNADASGAAGTYLCTSMTSAGLTLDPSQMGLNITLELKADGTGTLTYAGDNPVVDSFTWTQEGNTINRNINGTVSPMALSGNTVTITDEDLIMVFTKQ